MQFDATLNNDSPPIIIRIDIIKAKKILPKSEWHNLNMPSGLGQFSDIARNDNITDQGYIDPKYWTVLQTKYIKLNNAGQAPQKVISRTVTFNRSFKNQKPIKADLDSQKWLTDRPDFHDNISIKQLEWCVISTNADGVAIPPPDKITMIRHVSYRDQHGVDT